MLPGRPTDARSPTQATARYSTGDWSRSVFLMKADASGKHRLVKDTLMFPWVEWAAGGKEVLSPGGPVFATNLATGRVHSLLPDASPRDLVDLVGVSKDGRTIAVLTWYPQRLIVVTLTGQLLQRARTPIGWNYSNASVYLR